MPLPLPDYAKGREVADVVGTTSEILVGSPITEASSYLGTYHDPMAEGVAGGITSAVASLVRTRQHQTELVFRDPDLLAAYAAQLLSASIRLRRALEQEACS